MNNITWCFKLDPITFAPTLSMQTPKDTNIKIPFELLQYKQICKIDLMLLLLDKQYELTSDEIVEAYVEFFKQASHLFKS